MRPDKIYTLAFAGAQFLWIGQHVDPDVRQATVEQAEGRRLLFIEHQGKESPAFLAAVESKGGSGASLSPVKSSTTSVAQRSPPHDVSTRSTTSRPRKSSLSRDTPRGAKASTARKEPQFAEVSLKKAQRTDRRPSTEQSRPEFAGVTLKKRETKPVQRHRTPTKTEQDASFRVTLKHVRTGSKGCTSSRAKRHLNPQSKRKLPGSAMPDAIPDGTVKSSRVAKSSPRRTSSRGHRTEPEHKSSDNNAQDLVEDEGTLLRWLNLVSRSDLFIHC